MNYLVNQFRNDNAEVDKIGLQYYLVIKILDIRTSWVMRIY
jgi:hypothetical protein